jgi:SAM dependent carboxyl methyltransferase
LIVAPTGSKLADLNANRNFRMAEAALSVTEGMVGHGFYDRNSAPQWAATEAVLPWLDEAVARISVSKGPEPFTVADFGCSEGANSSRVLQRLVDGLRVRSGRAVLTVQSDLPTNDFTALLAGLRPGGRSVFGDNVYSAIVGGSMFGQLLPSQSVHVATTFNAIGFLSRRPLDRLPGYILPNGPRAGSDRGQVTETERRAFSAQARSDLNDFLRARAAELVPGGKLLVEVFGIRGEARTCDGIYDVLNDAVLEAIDTGIIDRTGYDPYYQPVYFRTLEELTGPVCDAGADLFRLDRAADYEVPVPFETEFERTGDVAAYAKAHANFFRAFTESPLCMAFPDVDPLRLAGDVFSRAERKVREDPERYRFRYASVAMLLTRL